MSIKSVFQLKCPACEEGHLFVDDKSVFSFKLKMNDSCPVCGEKLNREPGFYFGAMFISYIISGILSLIFVGVLILFFKLDWVLSLAILFITLAALYAYLFKVSRSMWIHLFVSKKDSI